MITELVTVISRWAIPFLIVITLVFGHVKKVDVFDTFVEGAKDGFDTSIKLIPFLVAMMSALAIFRASGAMEFILSFLEPVLVNFNIPSEIIPMAFMRPISGSSTFAMMTEILHTHGPDSFLGRIASTMQGSTDTTFYVLTVYFGAVGIRQSRHALAIGLIGDFVGFISALVICSIVFG